MLDVFNTNAFNTVSMTAAIEKAPFQPTRLGKLGLFKVKGISTLSVAIEEKQGKLSLLLNKARGTMPIVQAPPAQNVRTFPVFHFPVNDAVMADEVQGVRVFGSEDQLETVTAKVNEKLASMRQNLELTFEWLRIGAVTGNVLDGDASTVLYNLFTEFGLTQTNVNFTFSSGTFSVRGAVLTVIRAMEDALGMTSYTGITALCGDQFFDSLISHASVAGAYEKWQVGTSQIPMSMRDPNEQREGFDFAGVTWINYRGAIGGTRFIATDKCRFFPTGVMDLFHAYFAPAPFVETVNTIGKPIYAKQEVMRFDTGVELHANSSPLFICTRPQVLVQGTAN